MKKRVSQSHEFHTPPGGPGQPEEAAMVYDPGMREPDVSPAAVEVARQRNEQALLSIDGVMGVAVGRTPIGEDAIVLYLRDASVKARVPTHVEGYPVETIVTGEIDAYQGHSPR